MSGPGLKHAESHAAIHEAALNEARELNEILAKLIENKDLERALEIAYVTVEHWETRTLRHADAEERGLYKELEEENPELRDSIIALKRDHDTLRFLVKNIKQSLDSEGISIHILEQFYALVHVDVYHNLEEERILPHH
ncbi:hemerythrin domain-containing protein [Paucisalibacillus globulus]|uniref:hemerythrin domain-containing protein n=1 Tax=Paucisalibacillus globulus TaxID=351095 RepID=UPI000423A828|nr:hemerythrin domain-containing protein [Paucisalibacillus globulus]